MCGHVTKVASHHSIDHCWKPHAVHKFVAICFIELVLLPIKLVHCWNRDFQPYLLLWPWPWPDDLHMWTWPFQIYRTSENEFLHQLFKSYITDRHTYICHRNYILCRFTVGQLRWLRGMVCAHFYCATLNTGRSSREKAVRPFVCQTCALWQTGRKICPDFIPYER